MLGACPVSQFMERGRIERVVTLEGLECRHRYEVFGRDVVRFASTLTDIRFCCGKKRVGVLITFVRIAWRDWIRIDNAFWEILTLGSVKDRVFLQERN